MYEFLWESVRGVDCSVVCHGHRRLELVFTPVLYGTYDTMQLTEIPITDTGGG